MKLEVIYGVTYDGDGGAIFEVLETLAEPTLHAVSGRIHTLEKSKLIRGISHIDSFEVDTDEAIR